MKLGVAFPCSQKPYIFPCPQPDHSSPRHSTSFLENPFSSRLLLCRQSCYLPSDSRTTDQYAPSHSNLCVTRLFHSSSFLLHYIFSEQNRSWSYTLLYRILYPGHRYSTRLTINNRITKLNSCYQKPEVRYYVMVPPFHKTLELVLPNLSLCQMYDYIINCHVSFT
jgi:hypothetical protein